jgi:hypothetical protein
MYIITFTVFCLCTYSSCFAVVLLFCVFYVLQLFCCFVYFTFCSCFVVLCIFIFVCTRVGLLPPGKSPIAVIIIIIYYSSNDHYPFLRHI